MRIFLSAGEPSGDLHGSNLVRVIRRLHPDVDCVGFGGERMEAAGCRLLYPLSQLAVMGIGPVLAGVPRFLKLVTQADRFFQYQRPDAVVLIDYPGFNWWLARRAHFHGIPVFYFVPPQLWAWAGWRVKKMRRWVDHVLCSLPFEEGWYRARGVQAHYIGHPYFDELSRQTPDPKFSTAQRPGANATGLAASKVIGLLPGSRRQEVEENLSTLVRAAMHIHAARTDTRFLVACFKEAHYRQVQQYLGGRDLPYVEPCVGRTTEIIHLSHACVAVSGSVGLELLYHGKPSVVLYRVRPHHLLLRRLLVKCRFIGLVNLLADEEIFPEFVTTRCEALPIGEQILRWLNDAGAYAEVLGKLRRLQERIGEPGACERAARYLLDVLGGKQKPLARRVA